MAVHKLLAVLAAGSFAGTVSASPFADPQPDPVAQISLPPVIPSVPSFTDPINSLAPPLPVLQVPTPAKDSPPFQGSDLKPKKVGYFFTGAGDKQHAGTSSCKINPKP